MSNICEYKNETLTNEILNLNNLNQEKVILSVEDNLIGQDVMENIIKNKGCKYFAAYNGNEALEILKNNYVDLILMDLQLPGINGFETTKIIREQYQKHIPIIAITAYASFQDRSKCLKAGMDNYLLKPFNIEELYYILDTCLKDCI